MASIKGFDKERNKFTVLSIKYKDYRQYTFRTLVSDVSSFISNPVVFI